MCSRLRTAFIVMLLVSASTAIGQDVLRDGKLTSALKIVRLQEGFAGATGVRWTIAPDGTWVCESIGDRGPGERSRGELSADELVALAELLTKADIATLPATAGRPAGANPRILRLEFNDRVMTLSGHGPPQHGGEDLTTVEGRFRAIARGAVRILRDTK